MFITRFVLDKFIPLMHNGIKHIEISDLSQITILTGENGSGKSSLLRELTPYPATRTDYEKTGKKTIELIHENTTYSLTSDFSKTGGAHSFIRAKVELNESGTTEMQNDLVNRYFNYSNLLDRLVGGHCKICQMGRPERKHLIMATYPSDLTFILNHHKKICSKIRAFQNNLKMLQERKLKLQDSLLSKDLRERNLIYRNDLLNLANVLDRDLFVLQREKKQQLAYRPEGNIINPDAVESTLSSIYHDFCKLVKQHTTSLLSANNLANELGKVDANLVHLTTHAKRIEEQGSELKEEIEKLATYLETDTESAIAQCKALITEHQTIINAYQPDPSLPILSEDEYDNVVANSETILNDIYTVTTLGHWLWSSYTYRKAEQLMDQWAFQTGTYAQDITQLKKQQHQLQQQLQGYDNRAYPEDCRRPCKLRQSIETVIKNVEDDLQRITTQLTLMVDKYQQMESRLNRLKEALCERQPERNLLSKLENLHLYKTWGPVLTAEESIIVALNKNPTQVVVNFKKMLSGTASAIKVKQSRETLKTLETNLRGLTTANIPAKQFIDSAIIEKETTLRKLLAELQSFDGEKQRLLNRRQQLVSHQKLVDKIEKAVPEIKDGLKVAIAKTTAIVIQEWIDYLESVKSQVGTQLRDLEVLIRQQESFLTRLNDEVQPNINELVETLKMFQAIEKELSPVTGIPHQYIVRYINTLFSRANSFIRKVWNYEMELAYFKEGEPFDYSFKVLFNGATEVKDVNLCSEGQKAIINLAVTLAISTYRGFAKQYPLKLDEFTNGLSSSHVNKLMLTLGDELREAEIAQSIIVSHDLVVCDALPNVSWVMLSESDNIVFSDKRCIHKIKRS